MMDIIPIVLIILFTLALCLLFVWLGKKDKKQFQAFVSKVETKSSSPAKVHIESMSNGSCKITATSSGAKIRLSGGSKFKGTINGKLLELEVPDIKAWEDFDIKS